MSRANHGKLECLSGVLRRFGMCLLLTGTALVAVGCSGPQSSYYEKYEIQKLTVVFLDEQSLQEKYLLLSGRPPLEIFGYGSSISLKTVRGFFDSKGNTLYCPKMNFEVCGHELHHAVIGRFHPEH
jgi:hypothetical protein